MILKITTWFEAKEYEVILNLNTTILTELNCESNEYYVENNIPILNECKPCDESCKTCSGPEETSCNECKNNLVKQGKYCVSQCNDGFWNSSKVCTECDSSCETCKGGLLTDCLKCKSGLFKQQLNKYTQTFKCVANCKLGYLVS